MTQEEEDKKEMKYTIRMARLSFVGIFTLMAIMYTLYLIYGA